MFLTKRVFQDEQLLKSLSTKHEIEVKNDEKKPKDDGTAVDTQEDSRPEDDGTADPNQKFNDSEDDDDTADPNQTSNDSEDDGTADPNQTFNDSEEDDDGTADPNQTFNDDIEKNDEFTAIGPDEDGYIGSPPIPVSEPDDDDPDTYIQPESPDS